MIDWGENDEEVLPKMKMVVSQMHRDWYGNGQPGLFARMTKFIDGYEAVDAQRHRSNTVRLTVISILLTAVLAIVAYATFIRGH